jgi:hypothetical protein
MGAFEDVLPKHALLHKAETLVHLDDRFIKSQNFTAQLVQLQLIKNIFEDEILCKTSHPFTPHIWANDIESPVATPVTPVQRRQIEQTNILGVTNDDPVLAGRIVQLVRNASCSSG